MNKKTREVLHSSKSDNWGTPDWLFAKLFDLYRFNLDLCADEKNKKLSSWCEDVQAGRVKFKEPCLLSGDYVINEKMLIWGSTVFFCNPPYGRKWPKILDVIPRWAHGVFLLPSRTGSRWFQKMLAEASWVFFLKGRLKFKGASDPAPFDSVLFGYNIFPPRGLEGKLIELKKEK